MTAGFGWRKDNDKDVAKMSLEVMSRIHKKMCIVVIKHAIGKILIWVSVAVTCRSPVWNPGCSLTRVKALLNGWRPIINGLRPFSENCSNFSRWVRSFLIIPSALKRLLSLTRDTAIDTWSPVGWKHISLLAASTVLPLHRKPIWGAGRDMGHGLIINRLQ